MLHFLFTDPETGKGDAFFDMMKDFVERYRNKVASTDDFRMVANEHFSQTPIARRFGIPDLNWFFRQWVYKTDLPSYSLDYTLQDQNNGTVLLSGKIKQEDAPEDWVTVLPLVMDFGEKKSGMLPVAVIGSERSFNVKLPSRPKSIELDPNHWVLSDKTQSR